MGSSSRIHQHTASKRGSPSRIHQHTAFQIGSASRIHQPKGVCLYISSIKRVSASRFHQLKKVSYQPKKGFTSRDNFYLAIWKIQEKTADVFYAFHKEEFLKWKCIGKQRYNAKKWLLLKIKWIRIYIIKANVSVCDTTEMFQQFLPYTANAYRQTTDKLMFKSVISTVRWIRK